ncbi:ead/Ea22-like family protein [Raoultella planticola]|nr:ead/Ea22-like family protein [Raoultella planticola]
MTTDITELAQREKFEAWFVNDVVGADVTFPAFEDGAYAEGEIYDEQFYFMLQAMWMAWKAAGAELVEALEKAQQYAKERDAENQDLMLTVGRLRVEREELESRTVKLPEPFKLAKSSSGLTYYYADDVNEALSAAGIKWEAE